VETHVKVLAVLYIVFGVLGTLAACAIMAVFSVASIASAAAISGNPDAWMALPILGITGTALALFLLVVSLPGVIAGIGLLKYRPWARILTIVLSAINLIHFPLGTILGVYGLYVLLSDEGARLFPSRSGATI
jgi:hypothetical protein